MKLIADLRDIASQKWCCNDGYGDERPCYYAEEMIKAADTIESLQELLYEVTKQMPDWFDNGNGLHCRIQKALGDKYA